eukprot:COSAG02_NODE_54_length_43941_cov_54.857990_45_plen_136_part_00
MYSYWVLTAAFMQTELWFDGGLVGWSASAVAAVGALMQTLQPNAVAFQGPTKDEAVRWIGNENGHAAEPNWIASHNSMANGPGHANGSVVAPVRTNVSTSAPVALAVARFLVYCSDLRISRTDQAEVDTPFATVS